MLCCDLVSDGIQLLAFDKNESINAIIYYNSISLQGVIHLTRKHEGGAGSSKSVRQAYKGRAVDTTKYVLKKVPFARIL